MKIFSEKPTFNWIKNKFLDFFQKHGHEIYEQVSLIPDENDDSILFANAGMNPFKEYFYCGKNVKIKNITSIQPCLRAGGKHNDLDEVGISKRHHTYFEMLGNFSFGLLSPKDAIILAWKFLTSKNWLNIDKNRLWVTVYFKDLDTKEIWEKFTDVNREQIIIVEDRGDIAFDSDNFWRMADSGPCGPSTEIFYDLGDDVYGTKPGLDSVGDRYMEVWNIVFMKYKQDIDGSLKKLPHTFIDTGMGVERIACVMQDCKDNYLTDLFRKLMDNISYDIQVKRDYFSIPLRVISDHIRAILYSLDEGIVPSNNGRGYIIRRIIRRAALKCLKLGIEVISLSKIVENTVLTLNSYSRRLKNNIDFFRNIIQNELISFQNILSNGHHMFKRFAKKCKNEYFPADEAFKLYDTYGFPLDLILDLCNNENLKLDIDIFNSFMNMQREKSKNKKYKNINEYYSYILDKSNVDFKNSKKEKIIEITRIDDTGLVVTTSSSSFLPSGGGLVGDVGSILKVNTNDKSIIAHMCVNNTVKDEGLIAHIGKVEFGNFNNGDIIYLIPDIKLNKNKILHHTATHLLQKALREILSLEVKQLGSNITYDKLTFDFNTNKPLSVDYINKLTKLVNNWIIKSFTIECQEMSLIEAKKIGAIAHFENKYSDKVKVYKIGPSVEVCGGPHVDNTSELKLFMITNQSIISSNVLRIEAAVGDNAIQKMVSTYEELRKISLLTKSNIYNTFKAVENIVEENSKLKKDLNKSYIRLAEYISLQWIQEINQYSGVLVKKINAKDYTADLLNKIVKNLRSKNLTLIILIKNKEEINIGSKIIVITNSVLFNAKEALELLINDGFNLSGGGDKLFIQANILNEDKCDAILDRLLKYFKK